jgi:hypothetical protein
MTDHENEPQLVELPASWFPAEWKGNPWTLPGRWCLLPAETARGLGSRACVFPARGGVV